ncbi:hypothetical protein JCM11491_004108 [Sporobolomyces phaffii]
MKIAYYVSGHGYGHATRVSALSTELLQHGHSITIVTNAPPLPFASILPPSSIPDSVSAPADAAPTLERYAEYRNRNVDAGIVQPKAYDVDRQKTLRVLEAFLDQRQQTLDEEITWLREQRIDAVLSDATFLGCAAAAGAGIPGIIVSNFTFDSCYSYLSHPALESFDSSGHPAEPPLSRDVLDPLVNQSIADYACATLLLRLPGVIPLPAFDTDVPMPSGRWVTEDRTSFTPEVEAILSRPPSAIPTVASGSKRVVDVPLIVRPPSRLANTPEFRRDLLASMGVPPDLIESKVVLVSFGGQAIPRPRTRPPSPLASPLMQRSASSRSSTGGSGSHSLEPPAAAHEDAAVGLLPPGWIAIVTGLSGGNNAIREDLPYGFFASDQDVYVPDLTWVADCVVGKLGYGTCSETLSCKTPFVYVPRPLFVEEFGLKRLMATRGVALELARTDFEAGRWQLHIDEAYERGRDAKDLARARGFEDDGAAGVIRGEIERFMRQHAASRPTTTHQDREAKWGCVGM